MTEPSRAAWLCACDIFSFELGVFHCEVRKGKRIYCVRQKLHMGTVSEILERDER
jgi:hypothetical protein